MDQMTVSNVAKSSCEILEIATLVAYFTFDTGLTLIDSGANALQAVTSATTLLQMVESLKRLLSMVQRRLIFKRVALLHLASITGHSPFLFGFVLSLYRVS